MCKGKENSHFFYSPLCLLTMNFNGRYGGYDVIDRIAKNNITIGKTNLSYIPPSLQLYPLVDGLHLIL